MDTEDFELAVTAVILQRRVRERRFKREQKRHWKANKNEQGEGVTACVYLCFLQKKQKKNKKKMQRFSKWSFIVILQFFLLIIMTVSNIKQTIMKVYNIQSCQWMACNRFRQPFLLCTTFRSFLCTVHYFLCAFKAKMATYPLAIDDLYFGVSN